MTRRIAFLLAVLALALPVGALAEGGAGSGWSIRPAGGGGAFTLVGQPGDVVEAGLLAVNSTDTVVRLTLSAVGPQACQRGGYCFPADLADRSDAAAWADIDDLALDLLPGTSQGIPIRIVIPTDAVAGEHAFGLVAALPAVAGPPTGGMQIRIISRVGVPVYVTVGEPVPSCGLRIDGVDASFSASGQWSMTLTATNTGPTIWRGGSGTLTLDTPEPQTFALAFEDVCAFGCPVFYNVVMPAPRPGDYQARASLGDGACAAEWSGVISVAGAEVQQAEATRTRTFVTEAIDWLAEHGTPLLALGLIGLALALCGMAVLITNRKPHRKGGGRRR